MATTTRFAYAPGTILHGPGCVGTLGAELDALDVGRALLVTGRTTGSVAELIEPVRAGLGERLVAMYDETTPAKTLGMAADAAARAAEHGCEAIVAVGGGGTIDTATQACLLAGHDGDPHDVAGAMVDAGRVTLPGEATPPPLVAIPTTLAGADLSQSAGVGLSMRTDVHEKAAVPGGGVSDPRLMPAVLVYDAELAATTPPDILARSAMNGYDKGIELLYSRHRTPVTDATATRGLSLLQSSLPAIRDDPDSAALVPVMEGIALVQYGVSGPDVARASIIHAFGQALSGRYPIQQGVAHGLAAPHVLAYLFEHVDGRRDLLADALGVAEADDPADAVVGAVASLRDALGLPGRLDAVVDVADDDPATIAAAVLDNDLMAAAPAGLSPTAAELADVVEAIR